ncbi:MarR family winged helix-turn-helix transcriptional regulator [Williamsia sterculiae]|uniref:DNA-binding transcriptional regulator, MarR family n=1 Tax=Williamsia sterculiae TaxID=1344003 RepID=A0A1N7CLI4_9NOCA|nr:MarR family transcriptional regulator [Williamsia sterculiae]SIR64462.1 DNA-binding transcriptional regulator, MarR family [Williamsia sterculiae]
MTTDPVSGGADDLGIVDALAQLSFAVQNALARRAAAHELSLTQVRLLGILRDRTPGMRELAHMLELDKSSVTGLVDRAARRGLVRREASRDDRRVSFVALTDEGRVIVDVVARGFADDVYKLIAHVGDRDARELSRIASAVARHQVDGVPGSSVDAPT